MTVVTIAVPVAGTRMTLAEWERLPESSDRVELLEGVVVVTRSPTEPHQAMVTRLIVALDRACPDEYRVRAGPLGVLVRGIASYWLVDPKQPSLRILELGTNGEYVEVANAVGDEPVEIVHPFPVRLVPGELLR